MPGTQQTDSIRFWRWDITPKYINFMDILQLMPEAASSVATCSAEQIMLEMVQVRIATGVTRVV
jgi:hypothetical protein